MTRTFIQTDEFTKRWEELGFTDDDLRKLELELLKQPDCGPVIRGTGGLRKMRLAIRNQGKSGGARICYVDFVSLKTIYLITVYTKAEKENLSQIEKNTIKKLIELLEKELQC